MVSVRSCVVVTHLVADSMRVLTILIDLLKMQAALQSGNVDVRGCLALAAP